MSLPPRAMTPVDPFDLPEWLGTTEVTWLADGSVHGGWLLAGRLTAPDHLDFACDLAAIDEAYPRPVASEEIRRAAHQAWQHGQVLLVSRSQRVTLAVPGTSFTADLVLNTLDRFARAVGAAPQRYAVSLRLGGSRGAARPNPQP